MSSVELIATLTAVLARAPEWVRRDIASKDAVTRRRAEETLAALIGAALTPSPEFDTPSV